MEYNNIWILKPEIWFKRKITKDGRRERDIKRRKGKNAFLKKNDLWTSNIDIRKCYWNYIYGA